MESQFPNAKCAVTKTDLASFPVMYVNVSPRFFFFASRRRHTRCSRDWSSDVCSSDLGELAADGGDLEGLRVPSFVHLDRGSAKRPEAHSQDQRSQSQHEDRFCRTPRTHQDRKSVV